MDQEKKKQNVEYSDIGVNLIVPSPDNPRIINREAQHFIDLVDSIRAAGVLIPVHIRHHPKQEGRYDLLAGERRLVAAQICQQKTIPAIVHDGISDQDAFELTFAENFAREDLTVMEQGKAVVTLMQKYKNDRQAVASKMGKSVQWVSQRVALAKNLSKDWKQALVGDPNFADWPASHLQRIAVFPQEVQDELLRGMYYRELPTTKELDEYLATQLMVLKQAPWDLTNPDLCKDVKACNKCPKRSSARPGLFDDTLDAKEIKKNDRCLDRNCWERKLDAYIQARALELRGKYPNLVAAVMPDQKVDYSERVDLQAQYGNVAFQWKAAKEGDKDALPALIVLGAQAGSLKYIKFAKVKTARPDSKSRPLGKDGKPKPTPLKQRRVMLNKKRWFVTVRKVIGLLDEKLVADITTKDKVLTTMALAVEFGVDSISIYRRQDGWQSFAKRTEPSKVLDDLWECVKKRIIEELTYCGPITQTPDVCIDGAKTMAQIISIDIKSIYKQVSETEYPEPKCWVSLQEDGTQKKNKPKKSTKKAEKKEVKIRTCRKCGCTDDKPCITDDGPCHWVEKDLCSACASKRKRK